MFDGTWKFVFLFVTFMDSTIGNHHYFSPPFGRTCLVHFFQASKSRKSKSKCR